MKNFIITLIYLPIYIIIFFIALGKEMSFQTVFAMLAMEKVQQALGVSLFYCLAVAFINLALGIYVGSAMSKYYGKWQDIFDLITIVPLIIPIILVISGLHIFMIQVGLVDNILSVILINLLPTLPYSIKICRNAYSDLGTKYFEQAYLLGASPIKSFFLINLPLLRDAYQYVFLLSFVIALSQYAITAIIGGGKVVTFAMIYFPFFNSANNAYLAAFSLVFMCLPFVVMVFFRLLYCLIQLIVYF